MIIRAGFLICFQAFQLIQTDEAFTVNGRKHAYTHVDTNTHKYTLICFQAFQLIQTDEAFTVNGRKHTYTHVDTNTHKHTHMCINESTLINTSPTQASKNWHERDTSQLDQEIIIVYRSLLGKV